MVVRYHKATNGLDCRRLCDQGNYWCVVSVKWSTIVTGFSVTDVMAKREILTLSVRNRTLVVLFPRYHFTKPSVCGLCFMCGVLTNMDSDRVNIIHISLFDPYPNVEIPILLPVDRMMMMMMMMMMMIFCRLDLHRNVVSEPLWAWYSQSAAQTLLTWFFVIKPTSCTNFTYLFCRDSLHVSDSSSVLHQEFIHCTLSNGTCHTGL